MEIAAVGAFLAVVILWDLATVAGLRFLGVKLPFSFPFHFYTRKEREFLAAIKGSLLGKYVLISGFLLGTCPLFAGLAAYHYILRRYVDHSTVGLDYLVGSAVIFVISGVWIGLANWKKATVNPNGSSYQA